MMLLKSTILIFLAAAGLYSDAAAQSYSEQQLNQMGIMSDRQLEERKQGMAKIRPYCAAHTTKQSDLYKCFLEQIDLLGGNHSEEDAVFLHEAAISKNVELGKITKEEGDAQIAECQARAQAEEAG